MAGFTQKEAQGTSLWYVIPSSLLAGLVYENNTTLQRFGFVLAMVAAALLGASVGVRWVKRIQQRRLRQIFGISVTLIALIIVVRTCFGSSLMSAEVGNPKLQYLVLTWTGLAAGLLGGLLGIGGGVIVVPALVLVGGFRQMDAQGISLLYIVPTALYSAVLYRYHAKIRIDATKVTLLIAAGLIGAFLGARVVGGIPEGTLRLLFAAALAAIGILIVARARKESRAGPAPDWVI